MKSLLVKSVVLFSVLTSAAYSQEAEVSCYLDSYELNVLVDFNSCGDSNGYMAPSASNKLVVVKDGRVVAEQYYACELHISKQAVQRSGVLVSGSYIDITFTSANEDSELRLTNDSGISYGKPNSYASILLENGSSVLEGGLDFMSDCNYAETIQKLSAFLTQGQSQAQ